MAHVTTECPDRTCPLLSDDGPGVWVNGSTTRPVPESVLARVDPATEQPVWIERAELLSLIGQHFTRDELVALAGQPAVIG